MKTVERATIERTTTLETSERFPLIITEMYRTKPKRIMVNQIEVTHRRRPDLGVTLPYVYIKGQRLLARGGVSDTALWAVLNSRELEAIADQFRADVLAAVRESMKTPEEWT